MDIFDELKENQRLYNTHITGGSEEAMQLYREAKNALLDSTIIDRKTKELIILAIAVTAKCEGCIASHARYAIDNGVSLEEIGELVIILNHMCGSIGACYGGKALRYAEEYLASKQKA